MADERLREEVVMTHPRWPLAVMTGRRTIGLEEFASRARLHPQLVQRYVALGLLDATRDPAGELRFAPAQLAVVARIQRLRATLPLNYAALGLVLDLLDRIRELEDASRRSAPPWT